MFTIHDDNAREAEVDGGGDESGCYSEADNVYEEVVAGRVEWILVHEESSNITDDLARQTEKHGCHVSPGPVLHAEEDIDEDIDSENGCEDSISAQVWSIAEV